MSLPASATAHVMLIAADFAIVHLDADLRWLQTTLARVADPHQEVHP
jgi:hypothetical protein